jgi:hypothetical protein
VSNVVSIDSRNALSFSSFGDQTTMGPDQFRPRAILYGDRFRELDYRASYFTCTQHDMKSYDFEGRVIGGPRSTQPLIGHEKTPIYIPLNMRRPSSPMRMGKVIVDSFTSVIFGENRFPTIKVEGDSRRQEFAQAIVRTGRLPMQAIRMRQLGGSMGTVGLSWCFHHGTPRFEVHNAKNLYVHSWHDRVMLLPAHVTEVYLFYKVIWDGKGFNKKHYWFRRDWTPDADYVFFDVEFNPNADPVWQIDERKTNRHNDGVIHFEWIQNLPSDEIDGLPDYDGLYEQFDQLDVLNSVVTRGAIVNLDPTLKIKMDPDLIDRQGMRKGSDNALVVGESGDAEYMELQGTSIDVGLKLIAEHRRSILETAQCVIPDPSTVAAQGTSSVALKVMYAPMLAKSDVLREQYAAGIKRALDNMIDVAARRMAEPIVAVDPATGEETPAQFVLNLPMRAEEVDVVDPVTGEPAVDPLTGAPQREVKLSPLDPGVGGEVSVGWPNYFAPTYDDQAKVVTAMQVATGGKGFLSAETATDIASAAFGIDPGEERKTVAAATAQTEAMFPPIGGEVAAPSVAGATEIKLTSTDVATIITVNEARASIGLPPLQGSDGLLTLPEFKVRHSDTIAGAARAESGKTEEELSTGPRGPVEEAAQVDPSLTHLGE